jgi:hypothetical protein
MKNILFSMLSLCLLATFLMTQSACTSEETEPVQDKSQAFDWRSNPNSAVYPINAHPFGQSYAEWTKDWWQWIMSFDCASNPLLDMTGEQAGAGQSGPVFFLAGTPGGPAVRTITVPKNKALLFPMVNVICDYPCPEDFGFEPGPGQTVEDLLIECANGWIGYAGELSVTLDGVELNNEEDYRVQTDLFYFTGDPDLVNCLDPCVTGTSQEAVSDGYWMILKKLSVGAHTLHFTGGYPEFGFAVDVTYNITVE